MKEFVLSAGSGPKHTIDYQKELNAEQLDVVLHGDGPCLVLAGAGSGKTRTITYRVAYLLDLGVQPEEILLLTFTNKAAKQMLLRVENLLGGPAAAGLWGGTFHSIANRLLRTYATEVGRSSNFTILDQEDAKDLMDMSVRDLAVDTTARRFPSAGLIQSLWSYRRNAACDLRTSVERRAEHLLDLVPVLERIGEVYEERKRRADAMDFDDLLLLLRELLTQHPQIRERLSAQFRYILVDEYQDTNVIQADIVRLLASTHGNVLVVGDDAQSIYSFRAADVRNILNFPDVYGSGKTFRLVHNYRSTPDILAVANAVIARNKHQFKKELTTTREAFEKPSVIPAAHAGQEAQYVAEQILKLREEGTPLSEMAVLFRAAFHSQALEFELMKRDIPYEYRGGMKFFERAHVKDVVAHLRLSANPKDESAWLRILALQPGIGKTTAGKVADQVRGASKLEEVLALPVKAGARAQAGWTQTLQALRKMIKETAPSAMIRSIAAGTYRDYVQSAYPDANDRLDDIEQFALFAENYDDLPAFLAELSLTDEYSASRDREERKDTERVVLSTVHQAKGLEWDVVFVINLADGKFPNQKAASDEGGMEEERRLFYVAVTRARRRLFLTYPLTSGYDTMALNQPSPFLLELPPDVVEQVRLRRAPVSDFGRSGRSSGWSGEPTIVLDAAGERSAPPASIAHKSFLRDIEDL